MKNFSTCDYDLELHLVRWFVVVAVAGIDENFGFDILSSTCNHFLLYGPRAHLTVTGEWWIPFLYSITGAKVQGENGL
jgi:hypothetical protein